MAELTGTPNAERLHIGFFGRRNVGKSSLVNAFASQELSIVSDVAGTTTDPVSKAMELFPIGPVLIIDTPGIDDVGNLGMMRVQRTKNILNKTDVAVFVSDSPESLSDSEKELLDIIEKKKIPLIKVASKNDLNATKFVNWLSVSTKTGEGVETLRTVLGAAVNKDTEPKRIVGHMLSVGDEVVLVCPIDASAPKGRLILPQVQTIRDILDAGAVCSVCQTAELKDVLENRHGKVKMVITDSQVFGKVKDIVPENIPLTSFSILMAAYKGILDFVATGVLGIEKLRENSKVLISEGCTHHRQCEDIGTVKLPKLLKKHTGVENLDITFTSGGTFPDDVSAYDLIIHCGGCMLSEREVTYRAKCANDAGVLFTNYGTAIAYMNGILKRSLEVFPHLYEKL